MVGGRGGGGGGSRRRLMGSRFGPAAGQRYRLFKLAGRNEIVDVEAKAAAALERAEQKAGAVDAAANKRGQK